MNEFDLIARYFEPLSRGRKEAAGFKDDAAVLDVPEGQELVVSTDTLNAGVHFFEDDVPGDIARKALRVSLSDLAAMGADPYCYQLSLALPEAVDEAWLEGFSSGLATDQDEFGVFLSGGDTTRTKGPLSVSITVFGLVPKGRAVRRDGAKPGDLIVLSGPVGQAFVKGYRHIPTPRFDLVPLVREHARAAIDISDGLIADLGHVCRASGCGAEVDLEKIPLVEAGQHSTQDLLSAGDDYELLLAAPSDSLEVFEGCHVIGRFEEGDGVDVLDSSGKPLHFEKSGWTHF